MVSQLPHYYHWLYYQRRLWAIASPYVFDTFFILLKQVYLLQVKHELHVSELTSILLKYLTFELLLVYELCYRNKYFYR